VRLGRLEPLADALALEDTASGRGGVVGGDGPAADGAPVAAVGGDATALLLLLWKRVDLDGAACLVEGDAAAAGRVLAARLTP
jgi:hypothetical protein